MSLQNYSIREAEAHEKPAILNFVMRHFFPEEYLLNTYFAKNKEIINEEEQRTIEDDFRKRHEAMVTNNPCFVAVHLETAKIAGIHVITVEENPSKLSDNKKNSSTDDIPVMKSNILSEWFNSVLYATNSTVDFFQEFPAIDTALNLVILCVDPEHAGKGLATALIRGAVDWARSRNIGIVRGLFTSPYARRAAEKTGFKLYKVIDIMSFRNSEGNVIYADTEPYEISVMTLVL